MKLVLALLLVALGCAGNLRADDTIAAQIDADAARAKLNRRVTKTPGVFVVKDAGGDAVTGRYFTKDAVVVTRASGAKETHPFVAVPLLFRANTDELLDDASRENVARLAGILKELAGAAFAVEGHASAEGDAQRNRALSKQRAEKIQGLLLAQGVPAAALTRAEGFGADYARHPAGAPDAELQQDRRVLVVRER